MGIRRIAGAQVRRGKDLHVLLYHSVAQRSNSPTKCSLMLASIMEIKYTLILYHRTFFSIFAFTAPVGASASSAIEFSLYCIRFFINQEKMKAKNRKLIKPRFVNKNSSFGCSLTLLNSTYSVGSSINELVTQKLWLKLIYFLQCQLSIPQFGQTAIADWSIDINPGNIKLPMIEGVWRLL